MRVGTGRDGDKVLIGARRRINAPAPSSSSAGTCQLHRSERRCSRTFNCANRRRRRRRAGRRAVMATEAARINVGAEGGAEGGDDAQVGDGRTTSSIKPPRLDAYDDTTNVNLLSFPSAPFTPLTATVSRGNQISRRWLRHSVTRGRFSNICRAYSLRRPKHFILIIL